MSSLDSTNDALEPSHPEWCRVTLSGIGGAVITTDVNGRVTFLNSVAEDLTGWTGAAATGELPLAPIDAIPDAPVRSAPDPALPSGLRILVVEDNVDTAESLGKLLTAIGHDVRTRYTGRAGQHLQCARALGCTPEYNSL